MWPWVWNLQGEKELLGLWISETEGAKFWLAVFTELQSRGVHDSFVACVDGLSGLPEALETVFPHSQLQLQLQLCIVHKVRHSLQYVVWKERRQVARDLRTIYGASTLAEAEAALERLGAYLGCDVSHDQCDVAAGLGQADRLL